MSEYIFGLGPGHLTKKADAIAKRHGARLVNYIDAQCLCGFGCKPGTCEAAKRHWFVAPNLGSPFDTNRRDRVMAALDAAGIKA